MNTAIDLFSGLGGFTTGAEQAGVRVLWAANHWPDAVATHAENHPSTDHLCQDLHQADWSKVPGCDMILASPSCQGHARARGKERPHHDAARSTAWAVVSCVEHHRPEFFLVENVVEFTRWALYPSWADAMARLGYAMHPMSLDAADFGVPQNRVRLFLLGAKGKTPFVPALERVAHRAIGPSLRLDTYPWSPVARAGRSERTMATIAAARQRFGDRYLFPYYGSGSGLTGRSLDRPLGTVTTRDRWGLVDGDRMRMLQPDEYRAAMGFPHDYRLPGQRTKAIFMLGNAVCPPVARAILSAVADGRTAPANDLFTWRAA